MPSHAYTGSIQLGHADDSVTKRHYIDQPTEAPDFTAALGSLAR
ncbi:hypothetical protein [Nocardia brasiliensis]